MLPDVSNTKTISLLAAFLVSSLFPSELRLMPLLMEDEMPDFHGNVGLMMGLGLIHGLIGLSFPRHESSND